MKITKDQALLFFAEHHHGDMDEYGAMAEVATKLISKETQVDGGQVEDIAAPYIKRLKESEKRRKAELKNFTL